MRKIPYHTKSYRCRACDAPFEGYFVGRHYYCEPCRYEHYAAQRAAKAWVRQAIESGVLMSPTAHRCVDCGDWAVHWEHRDYSRPLDVEPTCCSCNHRRGPARFDSKAIVYPGISSSSVRYRRLLETARARRAA